MYTYAADRLANCTAVTRLPVTPGEVRVQTRAQLSPAHTPSEPGFRLRARVIVHALQGADKWLEFRKASRDKLPRGRSPRRAVHVPFRVRLASALLHHDPAVRRGRAAGAAAPTGGGGAGRDRSAPRGRRHQ